MISFQNLQAARVGRPVFVPVRKTSDPGLAFVVKVGLRPRNTIVGAAEGKISVISKISGEARLWFWIAFTGSIEKLISFRWA
jgi:hypothetical protein